MSKTGTAAKILLFIVLTPVLIGAGIYVIVNAVDYAERRFNPEEYWGRRAADEQKTLDNLDYALRGCLLDLQAQRRTYWLDVAKSVNSGLTQQDATRLASLGLDMQNQSCITIANTRKQSADTLASYKALQKQP